MVDIAHSPSEQNPGTTISRSTAPPTKEITENPWALTRGSLKIQRSGSRKAALAVVCGSFARAFAALRLWFVLIGDVVGGDEGFAEVEALLLGAAAIQV